MEDLSSDEGEEEGDDAEGDEEGRLDVDEDGRTLLGCGERDDEGSGASLEYSTRAWSGVLPMRDIPKMVCDCTAAYLKVKTRTRTLGIPYETNATYWLGADAVPATAIEGLVLAIFKHHTYGVSFDVRRSGAEWWTQVIDGEHDIPFHWDRDYEMHREQGVCVHPHLATVTYLSGSGGAPTVVLPIASPLMAANVATECCGPISTAHACHPRAGWHLVFDGRLLHGAPAQLRSSVPPIAKKRKGVPGERRACDARGVAAPTPTRVTLLVNVWLNWIPCGADPLHAEVARSLSTQAVKPSWEHPVNASKRGARRGEGTQAPPHAWTLTGFGAGARIEGQLKLTLPATQVWAAGDAEPHGNFVALRWARNEGGSLEHVGPQ